VNKLPVTGEVDFDTLEQLNADDKAIDQKPLYLPESNVSTDSWEKGFFQATGSWVEEGDKSPSENVSEIICLKGSKICAEAKAERAPGAGRCLVNLFIRDIARWDRSEIVTVPEEIPCARETIEVSRRPKSVLAIGRAAYKDEKYCQELFGESRAMVFRLEGGKKINEFRGSTNSAAYRRIMRISEDVMEAAGFSKFK
jgi:hypothetical protein